MDGQISNVIYREFPFHLGKLATIFSYMKYKVQYFLYEYLGWDFLIQNLKNILCHVWKPVHLLIYVKSRDFIFHVGIILPSVV